MIDQHRRLAKRLAWCGLILGLAAGSPMVLTGAQAQTTLVDPNAVRADMSPHDAAVAAAAKSDYIAALNFAKQAAAAGHPLDADQLDFITGKAAKQQAALDEAAKLKASQQAAAGTAQQILDRQQKEYAARMKQIKAACGETSGERHIGTFTSAAGSMAAGNGGAQAPKYTGADGGKREGCS